MRARPGPSGSFLGTVCVSEGALVLCWFLLLCLGVASSLCTLSLPGLQGNVTSWQLLPLCPVWLRTCPVWVSKQCPPPSGLLLVLPGQEACPLWLSFLHLGQLGMVGSSWSWSQAAGVQILSTFSLCDLSKFLSLR